MRAANSQKLWRRWIAQQPVTALSQSHPRFPEKNFAPCTKHAAVILRAHRFWPEGSLFGFALAVATATVMIMTRR